MVRPGFAALATPTRLTMVPAPHTCPAGIPGVIVKVLVPALGVLIAYSRPSTEIWVPSSKSRMSLTLIVVGDDGGAATVVDSLRTRAIGVPAGQLTPVGMSGVMGNLR